MTSQTPPAEPEYTSPTNPLSPVSPKPLHYPKPCNIPVLEKQIDPVFNQTALHMDAEGSKHLKPISSSQPDVADVINGQVEESATEEMNIDAQYESEGMEEDAEGETDDGNSDMENEVALNAPLDSIAVEPIETQNVIQASTDPIPEAQQAVSHVDVPAIESQVTSQDPSAVQPAESHPAEVITAADVGIDYQKLLDSLSSNVSTIQSADAAIALPEPVQSTAPGTEQNAPIKLGVAPAGLPPRPPPQEQPAIHPNYTQTTDIRNYHPHAPNPAVAQVQPNASSVQSYTETSFPPGTSSGMNGLPPPPMASFQTAPGQVPSPATQALHQRQMLESAREIKQAAGESLSDEDKPWTEETQRFFEKFLEEERQFVQEGNWEQFPYGSRLFVGNLSSERVTKRDIFHVFHGYGRIAQISIKQAYGFVQFFDAPSCDKAMHVEQGRTIRGKKINLEVSKPQKNSKQADTRRRSRSPDNGRAPAGVDRYVSGAGRRNERDRGGRARRDDYRPGRSPSPRGNRGRDRSRDRYDRYRSRSRSPQHNRSYSRDDDEDLPLPRRAPRDVPDVQIVVIDQLDRNFIQWVESSFSSTGVRADVLILPPRVSEAAVIKRQIIEGVTAVCKLTGSNQAVSKVPLQVFDRRGGSDVRFEEYADLQPNIAAQVVLRAKNTNATPAPTYGYGYGQGVAPQVQQVQQAAAANPNISNMISTMDPASLQKFLGAMQQSPAAAQTPQQTALTPDLAKLLGGGAIQAQVPYGQPPTAQDPLAALRNNPALAGLLGGRVPPPPPTPSQPQQGGQPDMADILARLGSYRR